MRVVEQPRVATYPLKQWDESGETTVTLREARAGETALRDGMLAVKYIEREENGILEREYREGTYLEIAFAECFVTFDSAHILYNGAPLFRQGANVDEFSHAWSLLPLEAVREWHTLVLEHNPGWSVVA